MFTAWRDVVFPRVTGIISGPIADLMKVVNAPLEEEARVTLAAVHLFPDRLVEFQHMYSEAGGVALAGKIGQNIDAYLQATDVIQLRQDWWLAKLDFECSESMPYRVRRSVRMLERVLTSSATTVMIEDGMREMMKPLAA